MNTERVSEMEKRLDKCADAVSGLEAQLDSMDKIRDDMISLYSYYGSENWYNDRESELPEGIKAGVLSEDAVYDQISRVRDAAFHMLELASDILKNRL